MRSPCGLPTGLPLCRGSAGGFPVYGHDLSPVMSLTDWTHSSKHSSNSTGPNLAKTLPKVSCNGILLSSSGSLLNQPFLDLTNISASVYEAAPQMMAEMAMVVTSMSLRRLA